MLHKGEQRKLNWLTGTASVVDEIMYL